MNDMNMLQHNPLKPKVSRNVFLVGMTSLFTDISSEMIYPLFQAFVGMILTSKQVLLGPVLGLIEGIAESTAALSKVFAGYYSDKIRNRKGLAIGGYGISLASKIILFFAGAGWYFVLASRFIDRIGKGIRTAPRDALIADSTDKAIKGKAYGFHRAMDFAGATAGALIAYFISLRFLDAQTGNLRGLNAFYLLFAISIIPAIIGVSFLFFIKENSAVTKENAKPKPNLDIRKYDKNLKLFFLAQLIFTLGNSSNQFLLLRSMKLGFSLSSVILMYILFNIITTLLSTWFGSLSDKLGRKTLLVSGYLVYTLVYICFGFISDKNLVFILGFWILYGVYYAMTEGVEKAFVADIAPADSKATAIGFYHTIVGFGLLPASLFAGLLFSFSQQAPFIFGGCLSLIASIIIGVLVHEKRS